MSPSYGVNLPVKDKLVSSSVAIYHPQSAPFGGLNYTIAPLDSGIPISLAILSQEFAHNISV